MRGGRRPLALAKRILAECCPGRAPPESLSPAAGVGEQRAAALIADLVATLVGDAVAEEREECAQIAEVLEPPGPETIAMLIRDRELTS